MSAILIITRLTLREATRRRIVLTALVLGIGFLAVYNVGFHLIFTNVRTSQLGSSPIAGMQTEGWNFLLLAGLYAVAFLSIAMGALLGADTLAGEISSGTVQTVAAKPLRRSDIVLGKWLGFSALLALYQLLMSGGVVLSVWIQSQYAAPHMFQGILLVFLESLVIMTVSMACSSRLSALATGGVVFGLYGLAFIGGWVEQLGSILHSPTAINVGIVSSLIIPSEAMWRRAAFEMQSPLSGILNMSPFGTTSVPSGLMVLYAVVYTLVGLYLALRWFSNRDL